MQLTLSRSKVGYGDADGNSN
ncbi:hypothetical protein FRAHR75_1730007 [Frankia sp. Hr75.2]|nr:hypothetical protein FRAHR75_1730007 [Frankia sp. Hr75.2]